MATTKGLASFIVNTGYDDIPDKVRSIGLAWHRVSWNSGTSCQDSYFNSQKDERKVETWEFMS